MKIALMSYLNTSGISIAAQEYFKLFKHYGYKTIPIWLMPPEHGFEKQIGAIYNEMVQASKGNPGFPLQFHAGLAGSFVPLKDNSALLGSIVYEGNVLTKEQASVCHKLEAVMFPSHFCLNTAFSSGIPRDKLVYGTYPLDTFKWNPNIQSEKSMHVSDRFKFLYMNTFYERKGWDVLLRAWFEEFSRDDPVELCIKSYKENDRDCSIENVISVFAKQNGFDLNRKAPIKVIDEVISSDELPKFMKSYDAYVSPHRSEGFGMNIWYAMALGIPVICTDYGGCTDFARKDTAWLFKKEKMVKPSSNELKIFPHLGNIVWAEPDVADMRVQIRSCLSNKKEREKRSAAGVRFVQDKYSCENSILAFEDAVRKINPILIELLKED